MRNRLIVVIGPSLLTLGALVACSSYGGPPPDGDVAPSYSTASVVIATAPPDLPVYEQPVCPGDGYVWTPGYWAWSGADYYWVPGTWVEAPQVGYLWTPGYWGWGGNGYVFHQGYWGEQVGFYGGINYGYGYPGRGFEGGRWDNGHFQYNRSVTNVDVTVVHNVYNTTVVNNTVVNNTVTRVSYNGGDGGIDARPTSDEQTAAQGRHIPPVAAQTEHVQAARSNPALLASANHGKPPIAATPRPGAFSQPGVVAASEAGAIHASPASPNGSRANTVVHPNDLPPIDHPSAPNTGNPAGPAIPATASKATRATKPGTTPTAKEAGPGPPTVAATEGRCCEHAAAGAAASATNAAVGAKTRPAGAGAKSEAAAAAQGRQTIGVAHLAAFCGVRSIPRRAPQRVRPLAT